MATKCEVCRKELNNNEVKYCRRHISYAEKNEKKKKRLVIDDELYWQLKTDASSNSMEMKDYIKMIFSDRRDEKNDKENLNNFVK